MTENYKLIGIKVSGGRKIIKNMTASQTTRHALMADRLTTARNIRLTNEISGQALFDGSDDIEIYTAVDRITNSEMEEMLQ